MSAAAFGAVWGALVLTWFHRRRPVATRLPAPTRRPGSRAGARSGFAVVTGRFAFRLAGRRRSDVDPDRARRLGRAIMAAVPVLLLAPPAAPAAGLVVWLAPAWRARRVAARRRAAVAAGVPEVVDLFALAVGAGLNVPLAVAAVGGRGMGPVAEALADVSRRVELGARLADVLDGLPGELGEPVRPLTSALVASERYGVSLGTTLDRLAAELRADRRRHAEEAARRVPIKLLFPLVVCILPAFALLTVVPLAASALGSLRL